MTSRLTRRGFLPLLAAALNGCRAALTGRARVADAFIVDPDWNTYRPILRALIRTVVPLDDPRFPPLPLETIEQHLLTMFPLENEQRFLGLQRTLILFDQVDLFPIAAAPLVVEEQKARDGGSVASIAAELRAEDGRAFAELTRAHDIAGVVRFTELPPAAQRDYLDLWRNSPSIVRREFHSAVKALIMMSVYSADASWPALGYAGPLVPKKEVGT